MNIYQLRALQNKNLKRMIELCYQAHPYYQKYMKDKGLTPLDFQSVNDLCKLPLISKTEYALDPESFRLNLKLLPELSLEEKTLSDIIYIYYLKTNSDIDQTFKDLNLKIYRFVIVLSLNSLSTNS